MPVHILSENASSQHYTIVEGDRRTPLHIIAATPYDWVGNQVMPYVGSSSFDRSPQRGRQEKDMVIVEFDEEPTTSDVLRGFAALSVVKPSAEDALRFAEKFLRVHEERELVFLHRPWKVPNVDRHGVLVLATKRNGRGIYVRRQGGKWKGFLFAAVVPR